MLLAPRLGATRLIVLVIAGQLAASVIFDHFGLLDYAVRPFNAWRALGGGDHHQSKIRPQMQNEEAAWSDKSMELLIKILWSGHLEAQEARD